jgi:hypothetical protein
MNLRKQIIVQLVVGSIFLFSLMYGRLIITPGTALKQYGFPFTWSKHLTSSPAGPVDTWIVNQTNLTLDLITWIVLLLVSPLIAERFTIETCRKCIGQIKSVTS